MKFCVSRANSISNLKGDPWVEAVTRCLTLGLGPMVRVLKTM